MIIGILSKQTGVSVETIRFYEQKGLLPKPHRRPSGYREYSEKDVRILKFILEAKNLGFVLNEIKELLSLHQNIQGSCSDVKKYLLEKEKEIRKKIQFLKKMKLGLKTIEKGCDDSKSIKSCPFLGSLDIS